MPASAEEVREATEDGVAISHGWGPVEVRAGEDGRVREVVFRRCVRVFDDEGRFAPVYDDAELRTVAADRVIFSIGQSIAWGSLLEGTAVALGRGGAAEAGREDLPDGRARYLCGRATSIRAPSLPSTPSRRRPMRPRSRSIGTCRARRSPSGATPRVYHELDKDAGGPLKLRHREPRATGHRSASRGATRRPSGPTPVPLREGAGQKPETARCLGCGASVVDENKCIGCGLCTTKCAFDAIHLHREHPEASTMIKVREDKLPAQSASTRSSGPSRSSSARSRFPRRGMQIWYTSRRPRAGGAHWRGGRRARARHRLSYHQKRGGYRGRGPHRAGLGR